MHQIVNKLVGSHTDYGQLWLHEAYYSELTFKLTNGVPQIEMMDWEVLYKRKLESLVKNVLGKIPNLGVDVTEDGMLTVHFQPNEQFQLVERHGADFKNTPDKVILQPRAKRVSSGQTAGGPPSSGITAEIWVRAAEEWADAGEPKGSELRNFRLALGKRLVDEGVNKTTASVQLNKWAKTVG